MGSYRRNLISMTATCTFALAIVGLAPVASAQDNDAIVLLIKSVGNEINQGMGTAYWCDDQDAKNYDPKSSTNSCNFSTESDRLKLSFQESISATLFTSSSNPATFAVTEGCTVGTSAWDPSSAPVSSVQVNAGDTLYVTALQGTGQCTMTGTSQGDGTNLAGASYTYTIALTLADQQPSASLPSPKQMRVGQRVNLQGPSGISTNAGQKISWKVSQRSRTNCRLIKSPGGAVVLRATARGTCLVQANAPGVKDQWDNFSQGVKIRVR
jgi:hypothetical protein